MPELLVAARAAHGWLGSLRHTEQNDQAQQCSGENRDTLTMNVLLIAFPLQR